MAWKRLICGNSLRYLLFGSLIMSVRTYADIKRQIVGLREREQMGERGSRGEASLSLSLKRLTGGPRGRAPLLGTLGYERKALQTGISVHWGSVGKPGVRSTGDFERWLRGLRRWGFSLSMGAL